MIHLNQENEVLVKENENLNLTVKAVTKIFNVEEFQIHKTPKGKAEVNNKGKLTGNAPWDRQKEKKSWKRER